MTFTETPLQGAFIVTMESSYDERGSFGRAFSAREFREHGLDSELTEISISRNLRDRTLRGMHYQQSPYEEAKLVRVIRGTAFDVAVDIRPASPTYLKWVGVELTAENQLAFYIPKGFAHGFLTLEENTDILYQISDTYHGASATGFAWNDPSVEISWPKLPTIISSGDAAMPNLTRRGFQGEVDLYEPVV